MLDSQRQLNLCFSPIWACPPKNAKFFLCRITTSRLSDSLRCSLFQLPGIYPRFLLFLERQFRSQAPVKVRHMTGAVEDADAPGA